MDVAWARSRWACLLRSLLQRLLLLPITGFVSPVAKEGREHLRGVGPAVFIANHASHVDTPACLAALGSGVRRRLVVAAAADYFYRTRWKGALVSLFLGTVPFHREGRSRASVELLVGLLRDGWSVLIFPAGTRGAPATSLKPGFAWLAVDAGVPVVPLHLSGPDHVMPKGARLPLPGGIAARIGEPLEPGDDYRDLVVRTERAMAELAGAS